MLTEKLRSLLSVGDDAIRAFARPAVDRLVNSFSTDIRLGLQQRALASTVDLIESRMPGVSPSPSALDLLDRALRRADLSDDRLLCAFGTLNTAVIDRLADAAPNAVLVVGRLDGEADHSRAPGLPKRRPALEKLFSNRRKVVFVGGAPGRALPHFLAECRGMVGFMHVGCGTFSSARAVLDILQPRLGPGAVVLFAKYFNHPGWEEGEHRAFTEFLAKAGLGAGYIGYHETGEEVAVVLSSGRTVDQGEAASQALGSSDLNRRTTARAR
jgi:hypothetical protein